MRIKLKVFNLLFRLVIGFLHFFLQYIMNQASLFNKGEKKVT